MYRAVGSVQHGLRVRHRTGSGCVQRRHWSWGTVASYLNPVAYFEPKSYHQHTILKPDVSIPQPNVSNIETIAQSDLSRIEMISQPEVSYVDPISRPEVSYTEPIPQPDVLYVEPISQPEVSYIEPTFQPEVSYSEPIPQPEVSYVDPVFQPEVSYIEPTFQPEVSYTEPIPQPEVSYVEPIPQPEVSYTEPIPQPDVSYVEPISQPEVSYIEPTFQPEVSYTESIPQPELSYIDPISQPEVSYTEPIPQPEASYAEPIPQPDVSYTEPIPQPDISNIVDVAAESAVPADVILPIATDTGSAVSDMESTVPDIESVLTSFPEVSEELFPCVADILADITLHDRVYDCTEWLGMHFYNPLVYMIDAAHFVGASWPVAILLVSVPVRTFATYHRVKTMAGMETSLFEFEMGQTVQKYTSQMMRSQSKGQSLTFLGKRDIRPKSTSHPPQYNQLMEFQKFMINNLKIDMSEISKLTNQKKLTPQMKDKIKKLGIGMASFSIIGFTSRAFTRLPLEGMQSSFLIWSNAAVYESEVVLPVACTFGAIFFTKIVAGHAMQGQLDTLKTKKGKVALSAVAPPAVMYCLISIFQFPGIMQAVFLFSCLGNQLIMLIVENHKPTANYIGYKTQDEVRKDYLTKIRENEKYRILLDERAVLRREQQTKDNFMTFSFYQRALALAGRSDKTWIDRLSILFQGRDASETSSSLMDGFYPYNLPQEKDLELFDKIVGKEEQVEINLLMAEQIRYSDVEYDHLDPYLEDSKDDFLEDQLNKEVKNKTFSEGFETGTNLADWQSSETFKEHDARLISERLTSNISPGISKSKIPDWEIFAEKVRQENQITAKQSPKVVQPWWVTDTVNKDFNS